MRRSGTLILLSVLALAAPFSAATLAHDQDDAGSGRDAGGSILSALRLPPGSYRGELVSVAPPGLPDPLLDQEDWFAFEARKGDLLMLSAAGEPGGQPILFEITTPSGAMAAWVVASPAAPARATHAVVTEDGWWGVRAFAHGTLGGGYSFEASVAPLQGASVARSGAGHVALSVALDAEGSLEADVGQWLAASPSRLRSEVLVFRDDGRLVRSTEWEGALPGEVAVETLGQAQSVRARTDGWAWDAYLLPLRLKGPGTFHVVLLAASDDDVHQSIHNVTLRNGTLLGVSHGGVHAITPSGFEAGASVSAGVADASALASREVEVAQRLVGTFACGMEDVSRCRIAAPDGSEQAASGMRFLGAPAGTWTFRRDVAASEMDPYPLFVADVLLPRA